MTKAFEDFMEFIKAIGPSPVQFGRCGVLPCSEQGTAGVGGQDYPDAATCLVGPSNPRTPPLSNEQRPIQSSCGHGAQRDAATGLRSVPIDTPAGNQAPEPEVISGASGKDSCGEVIHAEGVMRTASPNAASELQDLDPAGRPERCGSALRDGEAAFDSRKAKLTASTKAEVSGYPPPAGIVCAQVGETALDAVAGRVQAVNRVGVSRWDMPEFTYRCEGPDCMKTIIVRANAVPPCCRLCAHMPVLCSDCMSEHMEAGHTTDAMTAREMESRA